MIDMYAGRLKMVDVKEGDIVWRDLLACALIGALYFRAALLRFRKAPGQ